MRRGSSFETVRVAGGLLPPGLLDRVGAQDASLEAVGSDDYYLAPGERLGEAITRSWNRLKALWERFSIHLDGQDALTGRTRQEWLLPLFQELGFGHLGQASGLQIEGKVYPISHMWESVPIHLVGTGVGLDKRSRGVAGAATASPHGLVQEFLNRSEEHLWGIVSNGRLLRLLRDNASLSRAAYVEFDLEEMFSGGVFSDFAVLWLTCHASRMEGPAGKQVLERWRTDAVRHGVRALDALRDGVESAIETLGAAAVGSRANADLRKRLADDSVDDQELYRQILRVVYRFLFLLVAEARGLLLNPDADKEAKARYRRFYSATRLRELAEVTRGGPHGDLWRQHLVVAQALGTSGESALGLPALGGFLWSHEAVSVLEGATIRNEALLGAMRALTTVRPEGSVVQRVDYANLGAEELGSIYESLLEYVPEVNLVAGTFELKAAPGSERKTTGSYYTPTTLINVILDSALDPLLDEASRANDPEQAILNLKVVDPASGSGHFLIAAAHRIADRLARVRTGEAEPSPDQLRAAFRHVVGRCIYAVDLNPMAVELAKVALWIEAMEPGKPLTFLDHHIQSGNSIIGATPALIARGIPDEALHAIDRGDDQDDKQACTSFRKRNRQLRAGQQTFASLSLHDDLRDLATQARQLTAMSDDDPALLAAKEAAYRLFSESAEMHRERLLADAWCATVTAPKVLADADTAQPFDLFYQLRDNGTLPGDDTAVSKVREQAERYRFFHWHLAFPDVFTPVADPKEDDPIGWTGGFDLVLGNPPWDTMSPDVREFFRRWRPDIAKKTKEEQNQIVEELLEEPIVAHLWADHQRDLYATAHFFRRSGRYRLFAPGNLGKGDLNIYRAFVELALTTTREGGAASQVVPAGFYSGANAAAIRRELFDHWTLKGVWGFLNEDRVWFDIDPSTRFAIYAAHRAGQTREFDTAFRISSHEQLSNARSHPLPQRVDDIRAASPDALLIVEVAPGMDAQVFAKLTRDRPTFKDLNQARGWHPYRAEVHMGNDQHLFTKEPVGLPVYEGRMIDFYDHRAKNYLSGSGRSSQWEQVPFNSPSKGIHPQWFLPEDKIPDKLGNSPFHYRIGFLDVVNPERKRCLTAAVVPPGTVCGDTVPTLSFESGEEWRHAVWLALANSFPVDYLVRKRVSLHMKFYVVDSLPFPNLDPTSPVGTALIDRVLRLTCVSPEMEDFRTLVIGSAGLPGDLGRPPAADEEERELLQAEIDAIVARDVFGLAREELAFVLDTFEALRRSEEKPPPKGFGEFRSKRLVLEAYDQVKVDAKEHAPHAG